MSFFQSSKSIYVKCFLNLPKTFYPNGAIYIFKLKDFIRRKRQIPISGSIPYIMSIKDSLDIDNIFDLKILKKIERNEKF